MERKPVIDKTLTNNVVLTVKNKYVVCLKRPIKFFGLFGLDKIWIVPIKQSLVQYSCSLVRFGGF